MKSSSSIGIDLPKRIKTAWVQADKATVLAEIRRRKRASEPLRARQVRKERGERALVRRTRPLAPDAPGGEVMKEFGIDAKHVIRRHQIACLATEYGPVFSPPLNGAV